MLTGLVKIECESLFKLAPARAPLKVEGRSRPAKEFPGRRKHPATTEFMKTVLIYSGGLDSTVLLAHLQAAGLSVH
ncbi:MAG: hypothetical protein ACPGCT_02545, partial [Opitutales bacterium]